MEGELQAAEEWQWRSASTLNTRYFPPVLTAPRLDSKDFAPAHSFVHTSKQKGAFRSTFYGDVHEVLLSAMESMQACSSGWCSGSGEASLLRR